MTISASQFPGLYDSLSMVPAMDDMGCIMLDTEKIDVVSLVPEGADDLYFSETQTYVKGDVANNKPHVTLLFGLLELGVVWKDKVDTVLEGWKMPDTLTIESVGMFPGRPEEGYVVIVAHIKVTDELLEGHNRLRLLPHVDTFPEYKPHMTLAYVKEEAATEWLESLSGLAGRGLTVQSTLNYGGE